MTDEMNKKDEKGQLNCIPISKILTVALCTYNLNFAVLYCDIRRCTKSCLT